MAQKSEGGGGGGKKRAVDSARGVVNFHRPPAATKNEQSPAVSSLGWLFRFFAVSWRRVAEKNGAIEECGFSSPLPSPDDSRTIRFAPPHAKSRARSGIIVFLEIPSLWMDSTVSEFYFINPTSVRSIDFFFIITKEERIDEHLPGLLFNERRKRCKTRRGWSGFFMEMTEKME